MKEFRANYDGFRETDSFQPLSAHGPSVRSRRRDFGMSQFVRSLAPRNAASIPARLL